jgi:ATP-dependent Clp protease adaptor protein ClpS
LKPALAFLATIHKIDTKDFGREGGMAPDSQHEDPRVGNLSDTDTCVSLDEPAMFKVILHNDHYTTMDFVVEVLMRIFQKSTAEATRIMLDIHQRGHGICGIYTYDIAVTKTSRVHAIAKNRGFPLKCSYENT